MKVLLRYYTYHRLYAIEAELRYYIWWVHVCVCVCARARVCAWQTKLSSCKVPTSSVSEHSSEGGVHGLDRSVCALKKKEGEEEKRKMGGTRMS